MVGSDGRIEGVVGYQEACSSQSLALFSYKCENGSQVSFLFGGYSLDLAREYIKFKKIKEKLLCRFWLVISN